MKYVGVRHRGRTLRALVKFAALTLLPIMALGTLLVVNAQHSAQRRIETRGLEQADLIRSLIITSALRGGDGHDLALDDYLRLRQATSLATFQGTIYGIALRDADGGTYYSDGTLSTSVPGDQTQMTNGHGVSLVADPATPSGRHIRVVEDLDGVGSGSLELALPYEDIAANLHSDLVNTVRTLAVGLALLFLAQVILGWQTSAGLRRAADRHEYQSLHDALTGLPNRRMFEREAQRLLGQRQTDGRKGDHQCVFVLVDLDKFKHVNDTLGHAVGDAVLVEAARRLQSAVRPVDVVARLGGDEFGLILNGFTTIPTELQHRLQVIAAKLIGPADISGHQVDIGGSLGASVSAPVDDLGSVLRRADEAMYAVKSQGGGVKVWDGLSNHIPSHDAGTASVDGTGGEIGDRRRKKSLAQGSAPDPQEEVRT